jgi:DNA-binding winged helix-turn-helix (wHTH) protein
MKLSSRKRCESKKDSGVIDSFRIAEWVVNPDLGTLTRVDEQIQLEPQTMQVLVYLAEHAGALVTREDLFRAVWNQTIVTDGALTYCIHSLRKALGDTAKEPQFIQTIVKKGYRLIAPVWMDVGGPAFESGPYVGLTPFSEEHAKYFFGREEEVELLRGKVHRLPMSALIGPSGVGKSSLIRAGLLPSLPRGWRAIVCVPGERPFSRLAQALVTELARDTEGLKKLIQFEEDAAISVLERWRRAHDEVLLVVDQFEELFTLNPNDVQRRFAELVGRAAQDLGLHVLLVLRDDFLIHCHQHKPLAPVFHELTPLGPPSLEAMHRALVEPARHSGYVFEDETLPHEMVAAVGEERGALPLLAFAAARLWEKRDQDRKLLTRKAY